MGYMDCCCTSQINAFLMSVKYKVTGMSHLVSLGKYWNLEERSYH